MKLTWQKPLLRDYVNATLGFKQLGALMDKKPQSLMRMLSDNGNPRLSNISELVSSLRKNEGIELHVSAFVANLNMVMAPP